MNVRRATAADEATLRELWEEFEREIPEPGGIAPAAWADVWADVIRELDGGVVHLAEDDEGAAGVVRATVPDRGRSHLTLVYVRPRARRQGVAKALVRESIAEVREKGATRISLDVLSTNKVARAVWAQLGFEEVALVLETPLADLEQRLGETRVADSRGSVQVQSDDRASVRRALDQFVPRLESPDVAEAANGWIRIVDPVIDSDRDAQWRLSRELSHRLGAVVVALSLEQGTVVRFRLYERGRMVDEYLSVPTFYGELPKGDELALEANPTLVARLTGADRDEVRRVMRTAISPTELPPADELYETIARTMGLEP